MPSRWGPSAQIARLALACAVASVSTGCIESSEVACANGLACPADRVCDEIHASCVTPEQLTACEGVSAGSDCTAGTVLGACFDGVCLPRGCGNGFVEPEERCDDGNRASADGCRYDCLSNETCGNGVLDPAEACDDGNLLSHDGCDSRCLVETAEWTVVPVSHYLVRAGTAWDPGRHLVVHPEERVTWELAGTRWNLVPTAPSFPVVEAYYDEDLAEVVAIGARSEATGSHPRAAFDGAAWHDLEPLPVEAQLIAVVSDRERHVPIVLSVSDRELRAVVGSDAPVIFPSATAFGSRGFGLTAALDLASNSVVVGVRYPNALFWFHAGTWTEIALPTGTMSVELGVVNGHVWLLGSGHAYEFTAPGWTELAGGLPASIFAPTFVYSDETGAPRVSADGVLSELQHGVWTDLLLPDPAAEVSIAADPDQSGFVLALPHGSAAVEQLLTVRGRQLGPAPAPMAVPPEARVTPLFRYSSGRRAVVYAGGLDRQSQNRLLDASVFDGTAWRPLDLSPTAQVSGETASTYDASQRQLVAVEGFYGLVALPDDAAGWVSLPSPPFDVQDLAWDASRGVLVAKSGDLSSASLFELRSGVWENSLLNPDGTFAMAADERTGGIVWVPASGETTVWDRVRGTWRMTTPMPYRSSAESIAYDAVTGTLAVAGKVANGRAVMLRRWTSASLDETCEPAADSDGDGLAGCNDPDCYWMCSRCPPMTTCRF